MASDRSQSRVSTKPRRSRTKLRHRLDIPCVREAEGPQPVPGRPLSSLSLYPALAEIEVQDIAVLARGAPTHDHLKAAIQNLDEGTPLIKLSLMSVGDDHT